MNRSMRRRAALMLVAGGGSILAAGCPRTLIFSPPFVGHVEVENDTLAGPPLLLGGPDGGGIVTSSPNRATPVLPAHIETLSQAALIAYFKQLKYDMGSEGGQRSYLPCKKAGVDCTGSDSSSVYIQPEIGMDKWKHDTIPTNGLVVARVINYDLDTTRVERRYGFRAQRHAWWVVDRATPSSAPRSRFVERTYSAMGPVIRILNDTSFQFRDCGHVSGASSARARWWGCDSTAIDPVYVPSLVRPHGPAGEADSYFESAAYAPLAPSREQRPRAPFYARAEAWVTCGQGCCAADP